MSEHIKTGFEIIGNNFDDYERSKTEKWVSLDWLRGKIKERRDLFKGLADISELNWVLKLLEMEEKHER